MRFFARLMIPSDAGRRIVYHFPGSRLKNSWMKNAIIHLPSMYIYRYPCQYSYTFLSTHQLSIESLNSLALRVCDDCREITSSGVDRVDIIFSFFFVPMKLPVFWFSFVQFLLIYLHFWMMWLHFFSSIVPFSYMHTHDNENRLECVHMWNKSQFFSVIHIRKEREDRKKTASFFSTWKSEK